MRPPVATSPAIKLLAWLVLVAFFVMAIPEVTRARDGYMGYEPTETEAQPSALPESFEFLRTVGNALNGDDPDQAADISLSLGCQAFVNQISHYTASTAPLSLENKLPSALNGDLAAWMGGQGDMVTGHLKQQICTQILSGGTDTGGIDIDAMLDSARHQGMLALMGMGTQWAHASGLPFLSRLEIESGVRYSQPYWQALTVQPLWQDPSHRHHLFTQLSWNRQVLAVDEDKLRNTVNAGMAYRYLFPDKMRYLGLNVFFDHNLDYNHNRMSVGLDTQTSLLGASLNRYIPLTSWKSVDRETEERAVAGWDLELRGQIEYMPSWTAFVKGYQWDGLDNETDTYGIDTRVEWAPVNAIRVAAGINKENHQDMDIQVGLRLALDLQKPWKDQFKPVVQLASVEDRVWDKVQRDNTIRVQQREKRENQVFVVQTVGANSYTSPAATGGLASGQMLSMPLNVTVANTVGAVARLRLFDGGILTLGQNTQVQITQTQLTLITGTAQYVSGSTNVTVNVPGGIITLLGTDIDMVSNGTDSSVRVREGSITLTGTVSGTATITSEQMAGSTAGVVGTIPMGAAYTIHTDQISTLIDRVASPLTGIKVAPYPVAAPRILSGGTAVGDTIVFALSFNTAVTASGGVPQMMLTINGNARTAALTGGSGTNDLEFSYTLVAGDAGATQATVNNVNKNGSAITGDGKNAVTTIADTTLSLNTNDTTPPSGYAVAFLSDPVTDDADLEITGAEIGAQYDYTISSANGGTDVTGNGTISTATQTISNIDISTLNPGTLTVSLTLTDAASNVGAAVTDTATKIVPPSLHADFLSSAYTVNGTTAANFNAFLTAAGGTFSRNSVGSYYNASGVLQYAAANQPRFDHDPAAGNAPRGLLIEESSTNILLQSNSFKTAPWDIATCNAAGLSNTGLNTTAPDGSSVPIYNFGTADCVFQDVVITAGQPYTHSVWIKANKNATIGFRIPGTLATPANTLPINVTTQWQRFTLSTSSAALATTRLLMDNRASNGYGVTGLTISFFGAQIENSATATSYIPTTGSTVTRPADTLIFSTGTWYNGSESTLFAQWRAPSSASRAVISLNDNSASNKTELLASGASNTVIGGVTQETLARAISGTLTNKAAKAIAVNDVSYTTNAQTVVTDTSVAVPSATRLQIGNTNGAGGTMPLHGYIEVFEYYPARLTDTELVTLTSP